MSELAWGGLDTPVGPVRVACGPRGLARVSIGETFGPGGAAGTRCPGAGDRPAPAGSGAAPDTARDALARALAQLSEYFAGRRRVFSVPVDWSPLSGARRGVLEVLLSSVSYGETITYGALATRAGLAGGAGAVPARVVGQIMGSNPCPVVVPCHRVVASTGLGGYSGGTGIEVKRWLLTFEGAIPPTLDFDPARAAGAGGAPGRPAR